MDDGSAPREEIIRRRLFAVTGRTPPEPPATSRGRLLALRDRLPLPVQVLGWSHVAALALVVSLTLLLGAWWTTRARPDFQAVPDRAEQVPPSPGQPLPSDAPVALASSAPTVAEVVVDVAGAVRRPGVYRLPDGSRVVDALELAGGARPGIDLSQVNLARVLVDGEQILLVRGARAAAGPGGPTSGTATRVNLNSADQVTLESLPGVGPVTAASIIRWREENGPFGTVDDLVEVSGIGEVTLERLRPFVTV